VRPRWGMLNSSADSAADEARRLHEQGRSHP
jgi:hypothetical protein